MKKKLKIAIIGTRGIPACYSGFETCAQMLGEGLVSRGHHVCVYCRSQYIDYSEPLYKNIHLKKIPTLLNKYLETIYHAFVSSIHALFCSYDVVLYFNAGNSLVSWIPRVVGARTVLNVDGLDWKRPKWPFWAKKYIQIAEYLATVLPTAFVTDNVVVKDYYKEKHKKHSVYIPYGSELEYRAPGEMMRRFDLKPGRYVLFVGRLVVDNSVHHLVQAFRALSTDLKCVIVGGASYSDEYIRYLKAEAKSDDRILFTGYIFGEGYRELLSNAHLFIETSGVGGTHPALLEAMGLGNCVVVHRTAENMEVAGRSGIFYDGNVGAEDLTAVMKYLLEHDEIVKQNKEAMKKRAAEHYSWGQVTDTYEDLFYELL